jgi:hypothetical protein
VEDLLSFVVESAKKKDPKDTCSLANAKQYSPIKNNTYQFQTNQTILDKLGMVGIAW